MTAAPTILFIDAASYMGFAVGTAGQPPQSGSRHFAKGKGASQGAMFAGAMRFVAEMIQAHGTGISIFIEEPLPPMFKQAATNVTSTQILFGLPACIRGMAFVMGCFDVHYARVSEIRKHFIGKNPKGDVGKQLVMAKCRKLGWIAGDDEDQTHDRSDALAGWSFAEHKLAPQISQPIDDLFVKSEARKTGRSA